MIRIPHDNVVHNIDLEQLTAPNEIACDFDVSFGRTRIATGMVMLCDAPVYVQSRGRGAEISVPSGKGGVPWLKANLSCQLNRNLPLVN
jgi:hypothetical protein